MRYLVPYFGDQWGKFVEISAWKIQHPTESDENIKISEELDGNRQRWLNWCETVHFFWNEKTRDEITRYVKGILSLWKAVVPVRSTQKLPWMQLFHRWWTLMCFSPACWNLLQWSAKTTSKIDAGINMASGSVQASQTESYSFSHWLAGCSTVECYTLQWQARATSCHWHPLEIFKTQDHR